MAAQVGEVSEGEGEPTDKMDIDPAGSPKSGKNPLSSQGRTPTPKPIQATPTSGCLIMAFVVHGVACHGPCQARIQEVERSFGREGGEVIVLRCLLLQDRRRGKAFSSLVVFLKRVVGTAESMYMKMRGRKHMVEEYEWGRRPSHWAAEGW